MSTQADAYCLPRWVWRVADGVAIGGIAYVIVYYLTAFRFDDLFVVINRQVDFKQWYAFPPVIAEHLQYPSVVWNDWKVPFPYLPSAVVMFLPLSALPQMAAFALWIVLQAVALVVVLWIGLELAGARRLRGRLLIALGAVLLADNQVGWDFRTHNNNVIYLALVMAAVMSRAPWLSGLLFGISCNLKIYSGALLLVFVWRREYRLAVAIMIAAALIAIVLPIAVFGVSGFLQLLHGWAGQALFYNPPPGQPAVVPANLWQEASALLVGNDPASIAVSVMVWSGQAIWLVVVGGYFIVAAGSNRSAPEPQARLADVCVGLLAPLPFSVWFTPYHAIVLLPAYMLLLTVAVSREWGLRIRGTAVAALAGCQILQYSIRSELRGAIYLVCFVLVVVALGVVRAKFRQAPVPAPGFA